MKKTTFYKIGALSLALLGAGVFTSFDDAMTDEQKIEAAYNEMVMEYKAEQTEICKSQALAMAQAEWARMQAEMAAGDDGTVNRGDAPTYSGGSGGNTGGNYSGGSEEPTTGSGGNTTPTKDPNSATTKGGATQQGSGDVTTKGGAVKQGDDSKSGSNTNVSTKGGAVKKK